MSLFFIGAVGTSSIAIALLFFIISAKYNDIFLSYYRWSWLSYSLGFTLVLFGMTWNMQTLLIAKATLDMYAVLFLLYGICNLFRTGIWEIWLKISVFTLLWVCIATYLRLDYRICVLPLSAYDIVMAVFICYCVMKEFSHSLLSKTITLILFMTFGFMKAVLAVTPSVYSGVGNLFTMEFFYMILFAVFICLFYTMNIKVAYDDQEKLFQMMVENQQDVFFHTAVIPERKVIYITPSIQAITGYTPQEIYMNPRIILQFTTEEYADRLNEIFFTSATDMFPVDETMELVTKDGKHKYVNLKISIIYQDDIPIALEGSMRDITAVETASQELIESKHAKELMFSYISHELKTPTTSILGYTNALLDGTYSTEEERIHAMEIISDKAAFLKRMIDDLSQLSKLETHQYSFAYEFLSCYELALAIQKNIRTELEDSGIRYKYQIDFLALKAYDIIADPVRISQVAMNIVTNAIKFTKNKNLITVKMEVDKSENNFVVMISDKGTGIKTEDLNMIFNRYYRATDASSKKGRGLGLAISKEIVEAHGGIISAKSKYGAGTSFTFSIPLYKESEEL